MVGVGWGERDSFGGGQKGGTGHRSEGNGLFVGHVVILVAGNAGVEGKR